MCSKCHIWDTTSLWGIIYVALAAIYIVHFNLPELIHIALWWNSAICSWFMENCFNGSSWWRHQMERFSALLALCVGIRWWQQRASDAENSCTWWRYHETTHIHRQWPQSDKHDYLSVSVCNLCDVSELWCPKLPICTVYASFLDVRTPREERHDQCITEMER